MYGYQIREDLHGIYYALTYNGRDIYRHGFSFPTRLDAHSAAFNHMMFRGVYDSRFGRRINFLE